jgi:hypothetical protein
MLGISLVAGLSFATSAYSQSGQALRGARPTPPVLEESCRSSIHSRLLTGRIKDSKVADELIELNRRADGAPKSAKFDLPLIDENTFVLKLELHRARCDGEAGDYSVSPSLCDVAGCEEDLGEQWDWNFAGPGDRLVMSACGLNSSIETVQIIRVWERQPNGNWKLVERTEMFGMLYLVPFLSC